MKLLSTQTDRTSLMQFGREAISLFEKQDFQSLAQRFGYDLAFGRNVAVAIEEEFSSCVADFHAGPEPRLPDHPSVVVKYFETNSTNLFALVECVFATAGGCPILAELIVTSSEEDSFISLEEVSIAGA